MTEKRGSTFTRTVIYVPSGDDPSDLSSVTVTSSVKDANGTLYSGSVSKAGDNLSFTVTIAAATTATWPAGPTEWDVKFVYSGVTFYSATETFDVEINITP